MTGKKKPAIFVFNVKENKIFEVQGLNEGEYPAFPIFDQDSKGILYSSYVTPVQKLGMNVCLNRQTNLMYIREPVYEKTKEKDQKFPPDNYQQNLSGANHFLALSPQFSYDYKRLVFFGSKEEFISHTGVY